MHLRILNILSRNSKTWYLSSAEWCSCLDLVSHCSRSSCKALSCWTGAAAFLVLAFMGVEAEVDVEVEAEAAVKVEPEPLNWLFEIPSTLSLKTDPLTWDKSSDERKLVVELSLLFADEHLEIGRDILCGTNDDIRELSLALEIKRACVYAIKPLFSYEWRDLKTNNFYMQPLKRKNVYCHWVTCMHSNTHFRRWAYQQSFRTPWYF